MVYCVHVRDLSLLPANSSERVVLVGNINGVSHVEPFPVISLVQASYGSSLMKSNSSAKGDC